MKKPSIARAIAVTTLAAALAVAAPLAASAHVRVAPDQAAAGSYAYLTFRVPTEKADASTTKVEVDLPSDTPFGSVSYQPLAGWTAQVVTTTLATPVKTDDGTVTEAPTQIIWTADATSAIAPGQFEEFTISVGPVPDTGSIMMPAHQTYSDGSVVDWADPTPASGVEPQNPAPTLYVNDAPPSSTSGGAVSVTAAPTGGTVAVEGNGAVVADSTGMTTSETVSIVVAIAALVLAAVALIVAVLAVTRGRRAERRP